MLEVQRRQGIGGRLVEVAVEHQDRKPVDRSGSQSVGEPAFKETHPLI